MKLLLTYLLLIFVLFASQAQDLQFSQFNNSRLITNPSFAGSDSGIYVNSGYRNQWPGLAGNFVSYFFSADAHVKKAHTSIGFVAYNDRTRQNSIASNSYSIIIAPQLYIKKLNLVVKPSIQFSFIQSKIDLSKLPITEKTYFDYSTSVLLYNDWASLGLGYFHFTKPNQSFIIGASAPLNSRLMVNFSTKSFQVFKNKNYGLGFSLFYSKQALFNRLHYKAALTYKLMSFNIGYLFKDAISIGIGLNCKRINFGYGYDLNISKLRNSQGSHELILGIRILSKKIKNDKPMFRNTCL